MPVVPDLNDLPVLETKDVDDWYRLLASEETHERVLGFEGPVPTSRDQVTFGNHVVDLPTHLAVFPEEVGDLFLCGGGFYNVSIRRDVMETILLGDKFVDNVEVFGEPDILIELLSQFFVLFLSFVRLTNCRDGQDQKETPDNK